MGQTESQRRKKSDKAAKAMPKCCAECLMCVLPKDTVMYCLMTSEANVTECCSQMRVLPDSEQDETPEGACHPAMLRIEHKWCDVADDCKRCKTAYGEMTGEDGIRYQDIS